MRQVRFKKLLNHFGIYNNALALTLENEYLATCPKKGKLLPGVIEFLEYVKPDFHLSIITNGFKESQEEKMVFSGLDKYFKDIFTSESTSNKKPHKEYFTHAVNTLKANRSKCLVIGDNPFTDILGAKNSDLDSLWINTQQYERNIISTYYADDVLNAIKLS